eukprot:scaffold2753_cov154-Amphora_coffeaeformis.AAC.8
MSATNNGPEQQTDSNSLPPYRTMPLSRSWDEGTQEQRVGRFSQSRIVEDQRALMLRAFHNTVKAAEDVLKSPDAVATARLGITPQTVESSAPPSPPRYMTYRNNLAGRLKTPHSSSMQSQASPRQPQQPLDPVILSYDRSMENGASSNDDSDQSSSDGSGSYQLTNLYPPSNLQTLAFQYRMDESKPIPYVGANLGLHDSPWAILESSVDTQTSAATEPIDNRTGHLLSPAVSGGDSSSDDEEKKEDSPKGPAKMYLEALKRNRESKHHLPTPPRHFGSAAPMPESLLQDDDNISETEHSSIFNKISLQLSRSGEAIFLYGYGSDDGSDLPPPNDSSILSKTRHKQSPVQVRRKRCGICFILLAVVLLAALILFVSLVSRNWKPHFLQDESENRSPPLSQTSSPSPTTMPTPVSVAQPTVREPTGAPSIFPTFMPTKVQYIPTASPSWDRIRLGRLNEAVNLLSSWGRFELWGDPETPQAQAFNWWIENTDWELYSDSRKIQRYALAVLFISTRGSEDWRESSGWMTDEHECSWYTSSMGQICSQDTEPRSELLILHLEQNGLRGTLPAEVALLENLVELRIVGNQIIGSVPPQWSRLINLKVLELRDNMLAGGNLPSSLASLKLLEVLDLSENRLGGNLPVWVAELAQLVFLFLGGNGFVGPLPPEWSSLERLRILSLPNNRLTGEVPQSYGEGLVELRELHLGTNFINEWNPPAWQFRRLEVLDLSENRLDRAIPATLYDLGTLVYLNLADNAITGELWDNVGFLWALEDLNLSHNRLVGEIPIELGDGARGIRALQLQSNGFSGALPGSFRRFRRIELLRVDDTPLDRVDNVCRGIEDTLIEFYSDCATETGLSCPCCTHCCNENGICTEAAGSV